MSTGLTSSITRRVGRMLRANADDWVQSADAPMESLKIASHPGPGGTNVYHAALRWCSTDGSRADRDGPGRGAKGGAGPFQPALEQALHQDPQGKASRALRWAAAQPPPVPEGRACAPLACAPLPVASSDRLGRCAAPRVAPTRAARRTGPLRVAFGPTPQLPWPCRPVSRPETAAGPAGPTGSSVMRATTPPSRAGARTALCGRSTIVARDLRERKGWRTGSKAGLAGPGPGPAPFLDEPLSVGVPVV